MNLRFLFIACGISLSISSALSEDITTIDGKKYEGVTISRVEPDGLVLISESGIAKVPFAALPQDLHEKYGYDPEKAAAFEKQSEELKKAVAVKQQIEREKQVQDKALAEKVAQAKNISGSVRQVLQDGLIVSSHSYETAGLCFLVGHPKQNSLVDGDPILVDAFEDGKYVYTDVQGATRTIKKMIFVRSN